MASRSSDTINMSSPASFVTARQGRSSMSSPLDSSPSSEPEPPLDDFTSHISHAPFRRPAKPLTYELRNHSAVYLEDNQYTEAFALLDSLLVAGNSISTPESPHQAFTPPAQYLALASTLIVYPSLTTKAKSHDKKKSANAALHYLRNVSKVVDPLAENIQNAFVFTNSSTSRRGGRNRDVDSPEADFGERKLHTNVANAGSIWQRAEDFWQIVGWAFNCSVAWKNRWERWRLWLEVILDFVEADWQKRVSIASDSEDFTSSLIWRYIDSNDPSSRTTRRRIIRAILADGSPKSMREFTEVFKDETKERKKDEDAAAQKRKVLDIDNDEFGDYDLSEDEDAVPEEGPDRTSTRPQRKVSGQKESPSTSEETSEGDAEDEEQARNPVDQLGGMDAVKLRQRLLFLLADVAKATEHLKGRGNSYLPAPFSTVDDLFDLYTEFFRPLPASLFSILLGTSLLVQEAQVRLNTTLLIPLLQQSPSSVYYPYPNQAQVEEHYLPWVGNAHSYGDNAKISLLFESLFIRMMDNNALKPSKKLRQALETGVKAREKQAHGDRRKKQHSGSEEAAAKEILEMSQERLLGLLETFERCKC